MRTRSPRSAGNSAKCWRATCDGLRIASRRAGSGLRIATVGTGEIRAKHRHHPQKGIGKKNLCATQRACGTRAGNPQSAIRNPQFTCGPKPRRALCVDIFSSANLFRRLRALPEQPREHRPDRRGPQRQRRLRASALGAGGDGRHPQAGNRAGNDLAVRLADGPAALPPRRQARRAARLRPHRARDRRRRALPRRRRHGTGPLLLLVQVRRPCRRVVCPARPGRGARRQTYAHRPHAAPGHSGHHPPAG